MDLGWLALGVVVPSVLFGYLAGARLASAGLLRQREQTSANFNRASSWAAIGILRLLSLVVSLSRLKQFANSGSTVGQLLGLTGCAAEAVVHGAAILWLAHGFRGTSTASAWRDTLAQIACTAVQGAGYLAQVSSNTDALGHSGSTAAGAAPQAAFSLAVPYLLHGLVLSVQQDWPRRFTYQLAAVSVYWPLHAAMAALTATSGIPAGSLAAACEPSSQSCLPPVDAGVGTPQRQEQHAFTDTSSLYFFALFHLFMVGQACYAAVFDPDRQSEGACSSKGQPPLGRRRSRRQLYSPHGEVRPTARRQEFAQMPTGPMVSGAAGATVVGQTPDTGGLLMQGRDWATPPQERHHLRSRPEALQLSSATVAQQREGPHIQGEHGPACPATSPALYPTCLSPQHGLRDGGLQGSSSPSTANDDAAPPTLLDAHRRVSHVSPAARPDSGSGAHLPPSTTPAASQPPPAATSTQGKLSRALSFPRASLSAWVLPPSDTQQHDLWQLRQGLSSLMASGVLAAHATAAVTATWAAGLSIWRLLPSLLLTAALVLANAGVAAGLLLQQLPPANAWAQALCGLCTGPHLAVVLRVQQLLRALWPCGLVVLLPPQLRGLFAFRAYAIAAVQSLSTPRYSPAGSMSFHVALAMLTRTTQLLTDPVAAAAGATAPGNQAWAWRLLQQHLDVQHVLPEYLLAAAAAFALHTLLCRYSPPATAADPDGGRGRSETCSQLQFTHVQATAGKVSAGGSSIGSAAPHSVGGRTAGERGAPPPTPWPGRINVAFQGLRGSSALPSPAFGSNAAIGSSPPVPGPSPKHPASPTRVTPGAAAAAAQGPAAGHAPGLRPFGLVIGRQSFRTTSTLTFNLTSSPPLQEHGQRPSTSLCVPRHSMLVSEQIEALLDLKRVSAPHPSAGAPLDFVTPGQDHSSSQPSAGVSNLLVNAQRRRRRGSNVSVDLPTYYTASRLANLDLRPSAPSASASVSHSEEDGDSPCGPRRLARGRSVAWRTLLVANAPANAGGTAGGMPSPGSPRSDSSLRRLASLPSRLRTTGAAAAAAAAERAVREVDGLGPSGSGELPCTSEPDVAEVTPFQPPCLTQMLRRGLGRAGGRQAASAGGAPPPPMCDETAASTSRATAIGLPTCEVLTSGTSRATVTAGMLTASQLYAHDAAAAAESGRRASGLSPLGGNSHTAAAPLAAAALDPDLRKEALRQMVMARWRASMASEGATASGGAGRFDPSPPILPSDAAAVRAVSPAAPGALEAAGHTRPRSSRISFIGELHHSKPHSRTSSRRLLMDTSVSATEPNDLDYDDAASMYTADDLGTWPGPEHGLDVQALPRSTAAAAAALAEVAALAEDLTVSSQRSASCLGGGGLASGVASGAATALTGNSRRSLAAYSSRNTSMKAGPMSQDNCLILGQLQQLEPGPWASLRSAWAWIQSTSSAGLLLADGGGMQQVALVLLHAAVCTCRDLGPSGWLQLAGQAVRAAAAHQLNLVMAAWVLAAAAPLLLAIAHAAAVATGSVPLRLSNALWVARIAAGQLLQRAALPALGLQAAWPAPAAMWHVGYYAAAAPLKDTQYVGLVLVLAFGFAAIAAIGGMWQQGAAVLSASLGNAGAPAGAAASVATSIVAVLLVPLLRHAALLLACAMAGAAAGLAVARKGPQAACSALSQWARRRLPVQLGMQVASLAAYALGDPEAPSVVPFVLLLVADWPIRAVWGVATSLAAFPVSQQAPTLDATPVSVLGGPGLVPGSPAGAGAATLLHSPAVMQHAQVAAASAAVLLLLLLLLSGAQTLLLSWLTGDRHRTERYSELQSQLLVLKTQLMAAPTVLELLGSLTAGCEHMLTGCSAWAVVIPSSSMEGGEEQQLLELQHVSGVLVELRAQADLRTWPSTHQGHAGDMTAEPAAEAFPGGAAAPGDLEGGGAQDEPAEIGRINEEISCGILSASLTVGLKEPGQHGEGQAVPASDAVHSSGEISTATAAGMEPGQEGGAAVSAAAVVFAPEEQSPQLAVDNEPQEWESPDLDFLKARPGDGTADGDSPIGLRSRSGLVPPVRSVEPPAPQSPPPEPVDPRRPSDTAQAQRSSIPGQPSGAAPSITLAEYPSLGLALVHRVVWAVRGHTARAYSSAAALSDSVLVTQPTPPDLARLCAGVGAAGLLVMPLECLAQPYGLLVVACPTPADVDRHLRLLCLGLADGLAQALYLKQMQAEVAASEMVMQDIYPSHAVEVLKRRFHAQGGAAAGLAGSGPSSGARHGPNLHAPGTAPPTPLPYTSASVATNAPTMPGTDEPKPDTVPWPVPGQQLQLQQGTFRTPSHSLSGAEQVAQALAGAGARSPLKLGHAAALGDGRTTANNSLGSVGVVTVRTARGRLTSASGGSPFHSATGPLSRLASVDQGTLGALAAGIGPGLGLTLPLVNTAADADVPPLAHIWGASNSGGLGSLGVSSSGYMNAPSSGVFSPAAAAVASALLRMEGARASSPGGGGQAGHVASTGSNVGGWDSTHAATGVAPLASDGVMGTVQTLGMPNDVPYARWHQHVSVLFADIVGYTSTSQALEPEQVMALLHSLFCKYDALLTKFGVYKVETIGDCFMAATGLVNDTPLHALDLVRFGRAMIAAAAEVGNPVTGAPLQIRVGINSGRVMSGIVGSCRARYCLFGDTVNSASRMESTGVPGRIQITEETYAALPEEERKAWECRGYVECKGKGLMKTYLNITGEP